MAHDPLFEQRIAEALKAQGAKPEHKKMFGGVAFMVHGNMSVGITNKGDFMVRFDGSRHAEISKWPGAKPMTFGKGDMKGFLFVDADAVESPKALEKWVTMSLAHIRTLPKKTAAKSATKKPAAKTAKGAPSKKK
ncbi:MAG: TfoX/Sxy family protein [Flavobacteriales bacterium]|nr:TfoX/Sxy family protein [Flavobacteriales bacterium]MBK9074007.1 TfoX/Sxy family protein [Flavobacteriales bacterium]